MSLTSCGLGPIILISPPDVKIETTFFREIFSAPYYAITLKNSTKKEPLISQKSLFYAVFLKFFHCQHRCLFHIKFHQIVLRMAYPCQTIRLFCIPFARFPYHSQHWHTADFKFPILWVIFRYTKTLCLFSDTCLYH